MKLLIFEYFSSGMGGRNGLVEDGFAMLDALLRDFVQIPDLEILTVFDEGVRERISPDFPLENFTVYQGNGMDGPYQEALEACDCVLIVAPETDGILARLTRAAESRGKRILGSSASAVTLAGNKAALLRLMEENGIPVPRCEFLNLTAFPDGCFPFVIKPAQGTGGEGVRLIRTLRQWELCRADLGKVEENSFLVQECLQGEAVSVSCLVWNRIATPISLNLQHTGVGEEPVFLGITVPYRHQWADSAMDIAARACSLVPGLRGFVGVDFIMAPRGPVLLEINPRITFAYIALREVVLQNMAQEILALNRNDRCPGKLKIHGTHTCLIRRQGNPGD